ncbi:unnamed protein product [Rotaria sordida]|uniref:RGS domain-containing protein n=2 Tax=Rotaria sordida TaxID=392033 RepID=A0A814PT07_9BILA|nr:unnamed protein product [Rotaria sordida]
MFVFYKETTRTLKSSSIRKKRIASTLLSNSSSPTTVVAEQHRRCYPSTSSSIPSCSVLIFSAVDIFFRLTEGFVGQVEEVHKYCFQKIMSSRHSNQENSSVYESNRSRRQQPTPSNIPSNQQEPLNSSPSHSDQASKACCFCWCCCCSCSCSKIFNNQMTQVVPEHVAHAKLRDSINNNNNNNNNTRKETNSTYKIRTQRSIPATLSTISVTCDTDTSLRSYDNCHQQLSLLKKPLISKNNLTISRSSSALMNTNVHSPSTLFRNHRRYKSTGNNSLSSMSPHITTKSEINNILHEKSPLKSSISNKHLIKTTNMEYETTATNRIMNSTKNLSNKYKSTSLDDDYHRHHRRHYSHTNQNREIGKSVLEHLVFAFPDNVRRMLTGTKNLTVRTDDNRQPAEPIDLGEPPSIEEVKSWAESFDKLMLSPTGRRYFRDFLRSEYSEENFLFWMSCESLKNEQNPEIIEEKARLIYEDYISILSPKEVSLDSRVREVINKNMVEPSPHTFDEAQLQIYTLMHRDSYPRFINSLMYRRLLRNEGANT